ncbi:MAG TPA: GatB/YqeY domain-containing protein [Candidatus Saccharimonadales bacterium]|nr:GatB/YqeY domain-containing protein [Candidatus Saccharimonadales bacterium]
MLKETLNQDIKTALLSGDKPKAEVLKALKSAILYEEVALKIRDTGLPDDKILAVIVREAKKRAESAEIYQKAGSPDRAATELAEKAILEAYLPKQMSDDELAAVVDSVFEQLGQNVQMGPAIGAVKAKVGASADGARVAAAVKSKLANT